MSKFVFRGVANDDSRSWCRDFNTLAEAEACRERAGEYCERRGTSLVYDSITIMDEQEAREAVARHYENEASYA